MQVQRRLGPDHGLDARMFLVMFLLAAVYLAFILVLSRYLTLGLIIPIVAVMLLLQYFYSDKLILASLGAREVTPAEAPELHGMIERLAQATGISKPRVAIVETDVPNALATGRGPGHSMVAVTTGIMNRLQPAELEAVLAHELSHVIHHDTRVMAMASFFATVASFIVQMGMWGGMGFGGGYGDDRDRGGSNGFILVYVASIAVWAVSFVLIRALSRYREFAADRGSALITRQPSLLASALIKISSGMERIPSQDLRQVEAGSALMIFPSRGSLAEMFSTHPSLEHRLAKLREYEAELSR